MKFDILVASFPYGRIMDPDTSDWLEKLEGTLKAERRIGRYSKVKLDDTPITMTRNYAMQLAKAEKMDFLLLVDNDMAPDMYLGVDPNAKPFWESTFEFMVNHPGLSMVAAPYCGPPPEECCYIFHMRKVQSDHPAPDMALQMIPREMAAAKRGIEEVMALPTGLMLIDMRVTSVLKPPYFDYEYEDPPFNTRKASTEDVYFTRNASFAGVKVYSNWDAWAGHWKRKKVGKPVVLTPDAVRREFRQAVAANDRLTKKSVAEIKLQPGIDLRASTKPTPAEVALLEAQFNGHRRVDDAAGGPVRAAAPPVE